MTHRTSRIVAARLGWAVIHDWALAGEAKKLMVEQQVSTDRPLEATLVEVTTG